MFRAQIDHPIKLLQPVLFEHVGVRVVHDVAVVEGESHAVESERSEELGVLFTEKVGLETIPVVVGFVFAEDELESFTDLV
jgi:hypothetical protein